MYKSKIEYDGENDLLKLRYEFKNLSLNEVPKIEKGFQENYSLGHTCPYTNDWKKDTRKIQHMYN